jgi:hypothetical protein
MENVANVIAFHQDPKKLELREHMSSDAVEALTKRSRAAHGAVMARKQELADKAKLRKMQMGDTAQPQSDEDDHLHAGAHESKPLNPTAEAKEAAYIMKTRAAFAKRWMSPGKRQKFAIDGNEVTYGWIFIVNQLARKMIPMVVIKQFETLAKDTEDLGVIVGFSLRFIFLAFNVCLITICKPYQSMQVTVMESFLVFLVMFMCWTFPQYCLVQRIRLQEVKDIVDKKKEMFEQICTVSLVFLLIGCVVVPIFIIHQTITKIISNMKGQTALLNQLSWKIEKAKEEKRQEQEKLRTAWDTEEDLHMRYLQEVCKTMRSTNKSLATVMKTDYPHIFQVVLDLQKGNVACRLTDREKGYIDSFIQVVRQFRAAIIKTHELEKEFDDLVNLYKSDKTKAAAQKLTEKLVVVVEDWKGQKIRLKIDMTTALKKVMDSFRTLTKRSLQNTILEFTFNGFVLDPYDIPLKIGMKDGDIIQVFPTKVRREGGQQNLDVPAPPAPEVRSPGGAALPSPARPPPPPPRKAPAVKNERSQSKGMEPKGSGGRLKTFFESKVGDERQLPPPPTSADLLKRRRKQIENAEDELKSRRKDRQQHRKQKEILPDQGEKKPKDAGSQSKGRSSRLSRSIAQP